MSTQDSQELEDLFNSIVAESTQPSTPVYEQPKSETPRRRKNEGREEELVADVEVLETAVMVAQVEEGELVKKIGKMTRQIVDSLKDIGADQSLQDVASKMPDTKDRLKYIADLTANAANKVLDITEQIEPIRNDVKKSAISLDREWESLLSGNLPPAEIKRIVLETREFLGKTAVGMDTLGAKLTDIVVAQDFQDLTGQVIKKTTDIVRDVETQLLNLLIEHVPAQTQSEEGLLGPIINKEGRDDIVANQQEVDDLLSSLGF